MNQIYKIEPSRLDAGRGNPHNPFYIGGVGRKGGVGFER